MTLIVHVDELAGLAGRVLGTSDWLLVDQARIDAFADATGDHRWTHVDSKRAKDGPFGTTVAHGHLTLALVVPLLAQVVRVDGAARRINYGLDRVRFPAPVPAGSRVRLVAALASATEVAGNGVQYALDGTIEIEGGGEPACVLRSLTRAYRA